METTKGDELPDKAETTEFPDVIALLFWCETCGAPVETGGEVVC